MSRQNKNSVKIKHQNHQLILIPCCWYQLSNFAQKVFWIFCIIIDWNFPHPVTAHLINIRTFRGFPICIMFPFSATLLRYFSSGNLRKVWKYWHIITYFFFSSINGYHWVQLAELARGFVTPELRSSSSDVLNLNCFWLIHCWGFIFFSESIMLQRLLSVHINRLQGRLFSKLSCCLRSRPIILMLDISLSHLFKKA